MDWVPICELKDHQFDSQSRARAWVAGQVPGGDCMRGNHMQIWGWDRSLLRYPSQFLSTTHDCGTTHSATFLHLSASLPLLPVWMNVTSLNSWLSDFHTARFSDESGWYLCYSLVVIFAVVVHGGEAYLPIPPSWPEVLTYEGFLRADHNVLELDGGWYLLNIVKILKTTKLYIIKWLKCWNLSQFKKSTGTKDLFSLGWRLV